MRKKVDNRIRVLVENCVHSRQRAMFVVVGDRGRDQVVNFHYMLTKLTSRKPTVLWCYKKELGFSSHRRKRMKQIKKKIQKGQYDPNIDDPFELFVSSTSIRYCYYKESHLILGQTFGMCVLQDFEALSPNLLCRTIETVEGGGMILILLRTMASLKQLYALTMDVHSRFTDSASRLESRVKPRFNERFILSLGDCPNCLVTDDELNVLPLSQNTLRILPLDTRHSKRHQDTDILDVKKGPPISQELQELRATFADTPPLGPIIGLTVTVDQAKAVMTVTDAIAEKLLRTTVAITAARGRGKSAALGLCVAAAVAYSYSNIFVTAPAPENVGTVFEFIQKGFEALGMKEHTDFELLKGTSAELNNQLVRINVFRDHRQTIQYISPTDYQYLAQAELLVIDEAAAIPLPLVKRLMGPYMVLMSSTINGYEGTGRSLSLKLIEELKHPKKHKKPQGQLDAAMAAQDRVLKEVSLQEPIRYAPGDPTEKWLNDLLCLDATNPTPLKSNERLPPPSECELYMVDRDALFSYHKASERFLHSLTSLFVSSHYKNTPNDLLMMADAPHHSLFVLLPRLAEDATALPDVLVAIQCAVEGKLSLDAVQEALGRGLKPAGDLLPWTLAQHFVDEDIGALTGVRVVRIATHPSLQRMGYGSFALSRLIEFFERKLLSFDEPTGPSAAEAAAAVDDAQMDDRNEDDDESADEDEQQDEAGEGDEEEAMAQANGPASSSSDALHPPQPPSELQTEQLRARKTPPLLTPVTEAALPVAPDYLGTSFGLTLELFNFWRRRQFQPVYLRQVPNEITGEHSVIMLRPVKAHGGDAEAFRWLTGFVDDFRGRFLNLLGGPFAHLPISLSLSVLDPPVTKAQQSDVAADEDTHERSGFGLPSVTAKTLGQFLTSHDLLRLRKYGQQLADLTLIQDLLLPVCWLLFNERLPGLTMSYLQCAILMALGCQRKTMSSVCGEFNLPINQASALLNKAIHKLSTYLNGLLEREAESEVDAEMGASHPMMRGPSAGPVGGGELPSKSFEDELEESAAPVREELRLKREKLMEDLRNEGLLQKFSLDGVDIDEFRRTSKGHTPKGVVSLKRARSPDAVADLSLVQQQRQKAAAAHKGGDKKKKKQKAHH
ncbi:unnamed protein product [Vitrella brassicaformis CCMP3155]|uniref:RNA cytidine acetyltransferase n=3 Tax=Vitrella brassicaformis TaxID=1169539 RepID=A0A0G4EF24_VITBC|nr:unnamed protein product [Vitrella brassicaformis CCMP3155]|eukprot:CEL94006.1 unnamed protein product [Vitrella brassicaformis CCMP3155]